MPSDIGRLTWPSWPENLRHSLANRTNYNVVDDEAIADPGEVRA
jgi:hypothetical protein